MQLICVSRGSYSKGKAFAEGLASKLGCDCLGREDLLESATAAGIAAGKLEMASLKARALNERLALEREHFQAFVTAQLAERALAGPLVYHGRTGHLLLRRVPHVLRIRVVADMEDRITAVEQRFGMDRTKARKYVEQIEEDRRKWARFFYNVDWDASGGYDFIINLERSNVENVTSSFCEVVQHPEFRETPAARKVLEDLLLASRCRAALARDDRTYRVDFNVQADDGVVSITYPPNHPEVAELVHGIVEEVPSAKQILCSAAATRILWIQERFDPKAEVFQNLLEMADRWEAAVELLRFKASDTPAIIESAAEGLPPSERQATGGVEGDAEEEDAPEEEDDGGVEETFSELVKAGRAGGQVTVSGSANDVIDALDRTTPYSLVAVGETFLDKGKAARVRLSRELGNALQERMKTAVVQTDELKEQYLIGARQLVTMFVCLGLTAAVFALVFTHQREVMELLARKGTQWRIIAAACVALFVPFFAFSYGQATHYLLKLIKME